MNVNGGLLWHILQEKTICIIAVYAVNTYLSSVFGVLKYVGGLYVGYLALHTILSKPLNETENKAPAFGTGLSLQLLNVKIYLYVITLMSAYLIPYLASFPKIMLSGIGIAGLGCIANITWSVCGDKMQNIFKKYYRQINLVLGIFLLYCAVKILIG
ncbi:MAG: LysE family transporter [Clostridiales bacterium]|nr:LysE family transporter [Clostridiales bacterium]MCD8214356.1 LysE family transporter [Clostridiales bacterium]